MYLVKTLVLIIGTILSIYCLLKIGKRKKEVQKYPDSIKKQLLNKAKFNMYQNYLSVVILIISGILIKSNLFYILVGASIFFNLSTIDYMQEDELEEEGEEDDVLR